MPLRLPSPCFPIPVDLLPDSIPVRAATLGMVLRGARSFFSLLASVVRWWRNMLRRRRRGCASALASEVGLMRGGYVFLSA
jgi:hypothetical protein